MTFDFLSSSHPPGVSPEALGGMVRKSSPRYTVKGLPARAISVPDDPLAVWFYYLALALPVVVLMLIAWGAVERGLSLIRWATRQIV